MRLKTFLFGVSPLLIVTFFVHCGSAAVNCTGTELHPRFCLPDNYEANKLPDTYTVEVDFNELQITDVDDIKLEMTLTSEMMLKWHETRLLTDFTSGEIAARKAFVIDYDLHNDIWIPDLYIYNLTGFRHIDVLKNRGQLVFCSDKEVKLTTFAEIKVRCEMNFPNFPQDSQLCFVRVGSSNFDHTRLNFTTNEFSKEHKNVFHPSQSFQIFTSNLQSGENEIFTKDAIYSLAGFRVQLLRYASPYVLTYHIPCMGIVLVSYVSYFISPLVIPARVAILVTLFLVLTMMFAEVQLHTPASLFPTSLTMYIFVCLLYIFIGLLTLGWHLFLHRQGRSLMERQAIRDAAKEEEKIKHKEAKKALKARIKAREKAIAAALAEGKTPGPDDHIEDERNLLDLPELAPAHYEEDGDLDEGVLAAAGGALGEPGVIPPAPVRGNRCLDPFIRFFTFLERYANSIDDRESYSRTFDLKVFLGCFISFFVLNLYFVIYYNIQPIAGGDLPEYE